MDDTQKNGDMVETLMLNENIRKKAIQLLLRLGVSEAQIIEILSFYDVSAEDTARAFTAGSPISETSKEPYVEVLLAFLAICCNGAYEDLDQGTLLVLEEMCAIALDLNATEEAIEHIIGYELMKEGMAMEEETLSALIKSVVNEFYGALNREDDQQAGFPKNSDQLRATAIQFLARHLNDILEQKLIVVPEQTDTLEA